MKMNAFVRGEEGRSRGEGGEEAWTGNSKTAYFYHSFPTKALLGT